MNDGITINSELDLYEKGGNSAQARWITEKILNARKLGIISEVELAVLDTALSDDFGAYQAYQSGLNQQSNISTVDKGVEHDGADYGGLNKAAHHTEQAREYLSMTRLHIDDKALGVEHLIHYIRMAEVQIDRAISCGSM